MSVFANSNCIVPCQQCLEEVNPNENVTDVSSLTEQESVSSGLWCNAIFEQTLLICD